MSPAARLPPAALAPILLAASLVLVGCLGAEDDPEAAEADLGDPEQILNPTPDEEGLPHHNETGLPVVPLEPVTVSEGAEPVVLADDDGPWIWLADTSGGYRTADNGTTWEAMPDPFLLTADGWSLAQDGDGTLYAATTNVPSVEVHRSTDDGGSWELSTRIADAAPVADRPWIAADDPGEVALFFYDFGRTNSENCLRSTDGGLTWPDRRPLTGQPNPGGAAFDGDGNVHFVGGDGVLHRFPGSCLPGSSTLEMFPGGPGETGMIDVTASEGAVYASAPTPDNGGILLSGTRDLDEARTLRVSPGALTSNTYPTVASRNGTVAVAWYGAQTPGDPGDPGYDGAWHVHVALVEGFWTEDPRVRVAQLTGPPNHVGDICMAGVGCDGDRDRDLLDYFGVELDRWGGLHVAYGHDGDSDDPTVRYKHLAPGWTDALPPLEEVDGDAGRAPG